jgi:hypothetical protein
MKRIASLVLRATLAMLVIGSALAWVWLPCVQPDPDAGVFDAVCDAVSGIADIVEHE